eukprot:TRINITY_DN13483_c0_g1_i1.p1 TRINITY_DN13483_c0_g1~~TRINITY_DN13483_c0_g1_i1.p1  ORF type:complete len:124 (+),score=23.15 TRINITY_DN13483_c0_g1_i1:67-438(+)
MCIRDSVYSKEPKLRCSLKQLNISKPIPSDSKPNAISPILDVEMEYFRKTHLSQCSLFLTVQLYNYGKLLAPEMVTTRIRSLAFFEHVVFPITYADLSTDACIGVTIYAVSYTHMTLPTTPYV